MARYMYFCHYHWFSDYVTGAVHAGVQEQNCFPSPLKTPQLNMLTDWFSFHWQPSSTHLLLSLHFIIVGLVNFCNVIVDDFYKFQNCSQSWMHRSLLDYFCNQNSLNCRLQALGIYSLVRGFRRVSKWRGLWLECEL